MRSFSEIQSQFHFPEIAYRISGSEAYRYGTTSPPEMPAGVESPHAGDVEGALRKTPGQLSSDDLMALLSPAASPYLEAMAQKAREVTRMRFGKVMQLYAPLYLSNECRSGCTYCGFSFENDLPRVTLTPEQAMEEADVLHEWGIRHILLLTGEDLKNAPVSYIAEISSLLAPRFPSIGIEIYPLKVEDYNLLRNAGVDALTLYQETYDPERYQEVHLRGMKKRMEYRLDAPDRAGEAGFRRITIGALLGLSDPAAEVFFVAQHARHLMKKYWKTQVQVSLPRLRPADGLSQVPYLPDRMYVQYLAALRLYLPDAGMVLSTREGRVMRDHMADICITSMSAGSRTDPGGYGEHEEHYGEQFAIEDNRTVEEMRSMLFSRGIEPVMTDWSSILK